MSVRMRIGLVAGVLLILLGGAGLFLTSPASVNRQEGMNPSSSASLEREASVAVIGGADGPTKIYVAGKPSPSLLPGALLGGGGLICLAVGLTLLSRKQRKIDE